MDSLIAAAARALAAGDPVGALKRIALRADPPALALRGIAMAQLGEHPRARELLRRAARGFGSHEALARARCVVAEAEVALAMRDLGGSPRSLAAASATLEARADRANAMQARLIAVRRLLLLGRLGEAAAALARIDPSGLPPALAALAELAAAELALRSLRIGPAPAAQSYLDVAAVVAAAQRCGAEAIHPGYGFLSENPALAAACARANSVFVGPPADVLALVGDKVAARRIVQRAGVPVVPGLFDASSDLAALERAAIELGAPLLIKASGGGGGMAPALTSTTAASSVSRSVGVGAAFSIHGGVGSTPALINASTASHVSPSVGVGAGITPALISAAPANHDSASVGGGAILPALMRISAARSDSASVAVGAAAGARNSCAPSVCETRVASATARVRRDSPAPARLRKTSTAAASADPSSGSVPAATSSRSASLSTRDGACRKISNAT